MTVQNLLNDDTLMHIIMKDISSNVENIEMNTILEVLPTGDKGVCSIIA